jgi:hypothetical protein
VPNDNGLVMVLSGLVWSWSGLVWSGNGTFIVYDHLKV